MVTPRSFLFIPGDSEKKLGKADDCGADAIILDLEDSVAQSNKAAGRQLVADFLSERPTDQRRMQIWVRVNPVDSDLVLDDLCAVIGGAPDGIMQPKPDGPAQVRLLSNYCDALEAQAGIEGPGVRILPVATETACAPFQLGDYAGARLGRLSGLTWGAEDLSAALGASSNRGSDGAWATTYQMVRSLTLMAAHAADVAAIETLLADFKDDAGLRASSVQARQEGFSGRLAIHPAQVSIINDSFMPTAAEVDFARQVISRFADNPDVGTVAIDGKMLDRPHLTAAEKTVAQHDAFAA